jgi:hypothetical protein
VRISWGMGLIAGVLVLGLASPAAAAPTPLTGETLQQHVLAQPTTAAQCTANADGSTSYSFSVTGPATGPYTGTFTETINATVGPQTIPGTSRPVVPFGPLPGAFFTAGPLVTLTANFTINAFDGGTVTGTKRLVVNAPVGTGSCHQFTNASSPFGPVTGFYKDAESTTLQYTANIQSGGSATDRGNSELQVRSGFIAGAAGQTFSSVNDFLETFESTRFCQENNNSQQNDPSCNNNGSSQ